MAITHTYMDEIRLSYSIFYLSTVTEKMLRNSTVAFSFLCLPLLFHSGSFSQLRNFTNSSHTCKGWGSREGPAKTILQLEREGEMTFVYILLLRSKNIFQALKQLEEGTHQAFSNSVLLISGSFVFVFMHSISGNTCWILLGRGSGTADKNGLSVQTLQLFLVFLSMHVL